MIARSVIAPNPSMTVRPAVGFLHIGKTGGTALKHIFRRHLERTGWAAIQILTSGHDMTFPRLCTEHPGLRALFFVREPAERFTSGFDGRLRRGQPRRNIPWSPGEAEAFKHFATPNQLAEALSDSHPFRRSAAMAAMKAIVHVRDRLVDYLGPASFLESNRSRIFYIGDMATFAQDLEILRRVLRIDPNVALPTDDIRANRSLSGLDRSLSERAVHNLRAWYQADYEIYRWCQAYRLAQWSSAQG